jgi:putative ABC transport system permease protein
MEGASILGSRLENFKDQIRNVPGVINVTDSDYLPVEGKKRNGNTFKINNENHRSIASQIWRVDYDYIKTMGMHVQQGRDFSREFASDSVSSMIINKKMAEEMGMKSPLGTYLNNGQDWVIVGVVEDFHFKSLKEDITPLALVIGKNSGTLSIKINEANTMGTLNAIEELWDQNVPTLAFNYSFLDQDFVKMHAGVQRMGKIFNSFALFAIFVACLGLFALSAFMAEQRKKEISIRLVLGAPFKSIYRLLTLDYLRLILLAILIAVPIGWYIMGRWLEDFAYRITIGWEIFAIAGSMALFIALLTISYQAVSAALLEPLKSLRAE